MGDDEKQKKKERQQKEQIADHPSRDDVHEQRDAEQPNTSVVPMTPAKPREPTQTQRDRERADWEGMGQPQSQSHTGVRIPKR